MSNTDAVFTILAHGTPDVEYQWLKGNQSNPLDREVLNGETSNVLTIHAPTSLENNTFYSCRVRNVLGIVYSNLAKLTVLSSSPTPVAPSFTLQPEDGLNISEGNPLILTVAVDGNPTPTLEWFFNGVSTGITGTTFSKPNATIGDAGEYYCVATNSVGIATSMHVNVIVTASSGCFYDSCTAGISGWTPSGDSISSEPSGIPNGFQLTNPTSDSFAYGNLSRTLPFTPKVIEASFHVNVDFLHYMNPSIPAYAVDTLRGDSWALTLYLSTDYSVADQVTYDITLYGVGASGLGTVSIASGTISSFPQSISSGGGHILKIAQTGPTEATFYLNDVAFYVDNNTTIGQNINIDLVTEWGDAGTDGFRSFPSLSEIKAGNSLNISENTCWP